MPTHKVAVAIVPSDIETSLDAVLSRIKIQIQDGVSLKSFDIQLDQAQVVLTLELPG